VTKIEKLHSAQLFFRSAGLGGDAPLLDPKPAATPRVSQPPAPLDVAERYVPNSFDDVLQQKPAWDAPVREPPKLEQPKVEQPKLEQPKRIAPKLDEPMRAPAKELPTKPSSSSIVSVADDALKLGDIARGAGKAMTVAGVLYQVTQDTPAAGGNTVIDFMDPHAGEGELEYFVLKALDAMGADVTVPPKPWRRGMN
jgi:hypothetical protein